MDDLPEDVLRTILLAATETVEGYISPSHFRNAILVKRAWRDVLTSDPFWDKLTLFQLRTYDATFCVYHVRGHPGASGVCFQVRAWIAYTLAHAGTRWHTLAHHACR